MKSNIRKLRNEKQISQTELANIIGKTQQAVSHMEKDRDRISIESLITLAEYFGVSTDYILGLKDEKTFANENSKYIDDNEDSRDEIEVLKSAVKKGNSQLLYELILSVLLCTLEDQVQM